MNKPDIKTIEATIALIDNYPNMDIKELRNLLVRIKKISELPNDYYQKVSKNLVDLLNE